MFVQVLGQQTPAPSTTNPLRKMWDGVEGWMNGSSKGFALGPMRSRTRKKNIKNKMANDFFYATFTGMAGDTGGFGDRNTKH